MGRKNTVRINFTRASLEKIPAPRSSRMQVFDSRTSGLGMFVFPSGVRSFFYLKSVRGYPKRKMLGRLEDSRIEAVRAEAQRLNASLTDWKRGGYKGPSPLDGPREELTISRLVKEYVEKRIHAHSAHPERAAAKIEWRARKYLASWKNRPVAAVTRADVRELQEKLARDVGKPTSNRVVQLLRTLYRWAVKADLYEGPNPAAGIDFYHEEPRARFLGPDQMPILLGAIKNEPNTDLKHFCCIALWTGARKSDILSMRWQDVSLADNRWQVPEPKNRTPYIVALVPEVIQILEERRKLVPAESTWVFPSLDSKPGHVLDLKRAWKRMITRAGIRDFRQHDMRRCLGSWMAGAGVSLPTIGAALGHRSTSATSIYAKVDLSAIRRSVSVATRAMIATVAEPKQLTRGKAVRP